MERQPQQPYVGKYTYLSSMTLTLELPILLFIHHHHFVQDICSPSDELPVKDGIESCPEDEDEPPVSDGMESSPEDEDEGRVSGGIGPPPADPAGDGRPVVDRWPGPVVASFSRCRSASAANFFALFASTIFFARAERISGVSLA